MSAWFANQHSAQQQHQFSSRPRKFQEIFLTPAEYTSRPPGIAAPISQTSAFFRSNALPSSR